MSIKRNPLSEVTLIPTVKVSPNSVIIYNERIGGARGGRKPFPATGLEHLPGFIMPASCAENKHGNELSFKAMSRIKKSIKMLFWLSNCVGKSSNQLKVFNNNRVSLLTLTLSGCQFTSDNDIKKFMLNQFFVELRKKYKNFIYLWRQEFQKNGNIHFHILLNKYVALDYVRALWNRIQFKCGYLKEYTEKHAGITFKDYLTLYPPNDGYSKEKRYIAWIKGTKCGWSQPNSVDLHSLKSVNNTYAYITKYLTKSEQSENINPALADSTDDFMINLFASRNKTCGRTWFASYELTNINYNTEMIDGKIEKEINLLFSDQEIFRSNYMDVVVFAIPAENLYNRGLFTLFKLFFSSIKSLFNQKSINI
jgi:hypothetical protein